jgi:hypothetical protein
VKSSFFLVEEEEVFKALIMRAFERDVTHQVWHAFNNDDVTQIVNNSSAPSITFINLIGSKVVMQYSFEQTDPFQIDFAGGRAIVVYRKHT